MKEANTKRMTKWRTDSIYKPSDLNIHDPAQPAWMETRRSKRTCLGVGNAGTGCRARIVLLGFLCGYLYAHFTHVSFLRGNYYE
jgi:hypothetical protein